MSAALGNLVVGLVTSLISGLAVWLGQRLLSLRSRRRAAAFYGVRPGEGCLLVTYRSPWQPDSMRHDDVQALVDLAVRLRELGAEPEVVPADALAEAPGQRAELCIGGPAVNRRSGAHLARYLPGVRIRPFDPRRRDSVALVVGGQRFLRDPEEAVYAVLARFLPAPGARPVFVIAGQNGVANRGAASYLARNDRALRRLADGAGRFCLIVKVPAPRAYGHGLAELASDVTAAAFAS